MYARGHPPSTGCCVVDARAGVDGRLPWAAPAAETTPPAGIGRLKERMELRNAFMTVASDVPGLGSIQRCSVQLPHLYSAGQTSSGSRTTAGRSQHAVIETTDWRDRRQIR